MRRKEEKNVLKRKRAKRRSEVRRELLTAVWPKHELDATQACSAVVTRF